jgi:hypothetical protein
MDGEFYNYIFHLLLSWGEATHMTNHLKFLLFSINIDMGMVLLALAVCLFLTVDRFSTSFHNLLKFSQVL